MSENICGSYIPVEFTPQVESQCLKQVEFYFSEFNYPFDRFLKTTAEKNEGWVPISTVASFNRMKRFRPVDEVVKILRKSTVLEVSADGENVKRRTPLNMEDRTSRNERILAIMNFPRLDDDKEAVTNDDKLQVQEEIEKFLFGLKSCAMMIQQVRLKRDHKKRFNGTVIIEFSNEEDCKNFIEIYGKEDSLSYNGRKLDVLKKQQYDLQREATRSKNFGGNGQRSRSFAGHRKNMPRAKNDRAKQEDTEPSDKVENTKDAEPSDKVENTKDAESTAVSISK